MRLCLAAVCLVLVPCLGPDAKVQAQDLAELISDEVALAIVVDEPRALEREVRAFAQASGLMAPPSPWQILAEGLQLPADVLQVERSVACVSRDLLNFVVFLPVSDQAAQALKQANTPEREGVYSFAMGFHGVLRQGYLVLALEGSTLAAFREAPHSALAAAWQGELAKARAAGQVFFWMQPERCQAILAQQLGPGGAGAAENEAESALRMAQAALGQLAACYGYLTVNETALHIRGRLVPRPDSAVATWRAGLKPEPADLLDRLPGGSFWVAGGVDGPAVHAPAMALIRQVLQVREVRHALGAGQPEQTARFLELMDVLCNSQGIQAVYGGQRPHPLSEWYGYAEPAKALDAARRLVKEFPQFIQPQGDDLGFVIDQVEAKIGEREGILLRWRGPSAGGRVPPFDFVGQVLLNGRSTLAIAQVKDGLGALVCEDPADVGQWDNPLPEPLGQTAVVRQTLDQLSHKPLAILLMDPVGMVSHLTGEPRPRAPNQQPAMLAITQAPDGLGYELRITADHQRMIIESLVTRTSTLFDEIETD